VAAKKALPKSAGDPIVAFASPKAFGAWLKAHHATSPGVWLKIAKKGAGTASVTYAEAIDVALCWGWIDGQKRPLDETAWLQRFSPRGPRSIWSKINVDKAVALVASGAMKAPGLAQVERAKADGRWQKAYAGAKTATVPAELAAALARNRKAAQFFASLDRTNRYAFIFRVHQGKKAETRERTAARFVAMMARGEKLHP
jgi:uncharacterized protein YdeI (YjbR/CyaY-like superfamily)